MHWACSKITASLAIPDATLLEILLDKVFSTSLAIPDANHAAFRNNS